MMDAYSCLLHLTAGILMGKKTHLTYGFFLCLEGHLKLDAIFPLYATIAFLKFILFSVFEIRYMLLIWKMRRQSSETNENERRQLALLYARFCRWNLIISLPNTLISKLFGSYFSERTRFVFRWLFGTGTYYFLRISRSNFVLVCLPVIFLLDTPDYP
jgi:hypothetical protein